MTTVTTEEGGTITSKEGERFVRAPLRGLCTCAPARSGWRTAEMAALPGPYGSEMAVLPGPYAYTIGLSAGVKWHRDSVTGSNVAGSLLISSTARLPFACLTACTATRLLDDVAATIWSPATPSLVSICRP